MFVCSRVDASSFVRLVDLLSVCLMLLVSVHRCLHVRVCAFVYLFSCSVAQLLVYQRV